MSARPDSGASKGTANRPPLRAGAVAWLVSVVALAATSAVAYSGGDIATARVAAFGVFIALAVACVAAGLPGKAEAGRRDKSKEKLPVVYAVAVAVTILLVIFSMGLTLSRQPAGAWVLAVPVVAGPIAMLAMRPRRRSPTRRTRMGARRRKARRGPASPPFMRPGWERIVASRGLAVALDAGFWATARRKLRPDALEQGGVALMLRTDETLVVVGMVFPTQVRASAVRCEFSAVEVDRVRRAINSVPTELRIVPGTMKVAWAHTHPRLGVFLSGTDHNTAAQWRGLDPAFTPIVIDVSQPSLETQIGVFNADGRKILPIDIVDGLVAPAAAGRLRRAIEASYDEDGLALPLVLLAAQPSPVRRDLHVERG